MGQKTHPFGFRLGVIKTWNSKWFDAKNYQKWLHEDIRIKRAVKDYLYNANIASVEVERAANKAKVIVYTARPGMVKSRDQLIDAAYGENTYVDDRTIDSHVKRVRKKFRTTDDTFNQIETLYGIGYRYKER